MQIFLEQQNKFANIIYFTYLCIEIKNNRIMGYTHYWSFKNQVAPQDIDYGCKKFKKAVALFKKCLAECNGKTHYPNWGDNRFEKEVPMVLAGGNGHGEPIITDTDVIFNGEWENDNSHETFAISIDMGGSNFCKTDRKPYDTAVCLALLCFKRAFEDDFNFFSDGVRGEWDWAKSIFYKVAKK